ncbi:RING finger protein 212B-like isoform X1 [Gadus macrocephalus]|uniref:RING finger protein 212B-like isoform X1 n=1 Tax=Gadus macrocephalus TaxID=80720 RepID=UPI0028CB4759|nr:RING finger protein 212B-like isoform X1 [Gadus macrocephalus]XP_059914996.1 RING finger protein 212B-like isoform X1 [Gadus macrocephalus]
MDWFHCNRCFRRKGPKFFVSSCGHICCEGCINSTEQCTVCGASCHYLPLTDAMKPQEEVFFKDPVKLIQTRLEHITQIALFQRKQKERVTAYFKHKSSELERRLKEATEQGYRQVCELKRQNAELKKPLSQRRVSPGQFLTSSAHRISLPVAVTPPVTPCPQNMSHPSSAESQGRARGPRLSLMTPPGSARSMSTHTSHQDFSTPVSYTPPFRAGNQNPNVFQFQLFSGSSLQSPRPGRNWH